MGDEYTDYYGLAKIGPGEHLSKDSYKFTQADRELISRLLWLGAEGHKHTGGVTGSISLDAAPLLSVNTTDGSMPAGTRYHYKFTLVDPQGFESAASPSAYADTPAAVAAPAAPTNPVVAATGGTLPRGNYYYVLSAYTQFDNLETVGGAAVFASIPYANGTTNKITLTLPTLPGGADGFNVYRRTPSGAGYFHIATIDMTVGSPPTTFMDNGSYTEDCDRFAPETSTALARNAVHVGLPSTLSVPAGYSWRVYRSTSSTDFTNSLLATVDGTTTLYVDTGITTGAGQPPTVGVFPGAPEQVNLTNGAEVTGRLPMSRMSAFPHCERFSFAGAVTPAVGSFVWVCPFPQATLIGVRAALGRGSTPNVDPVIVTVNRERGGGYSEIFTSAHRPSVPAGNQIGASSAPDAITELVAGDALTVDILQNGGGTNTDTDLTVMVYMYVYGWTASASHVWATP